MKDVVRRHAVEHADADGLSLLPVAGLRTMYVDSPREKLQSTYRPLVCLVLQGAKHLLVGCQEHLCEEGQSVIVSSDMPVAGQVVRASRDKPYIAMAVALDLALMAELAETLDDSERQLASSAKTMFVQPTDVDVMDCGLRLMRLIGRPNAIAALHAGLMRELHFWLLSGPHGPQLRSVVKPYSTACRLGRALALLRSGYKERLPVEALAEAAAMSLTVFHKQFKELTSLTPGQYQKRLRLIEARRLMLYDGLRANAAAFEVGYESVPQFTREYGRMFGLPPSRSTRNTAGSNPATCPVSAAPGNALRHATLGGSQF